jgi:hypothetical protein
MKRLPFQVEISRAQILATRLATVHFAPEDLKLTLTATPMGFAGIQKRWLFARSARDHRIDTDTRQRNVSQIAAKNMKPPQPQGHQHLTPDAARPGHLPPIGKPLWPLP